MNTVTLINSTPRIITRPSQNDEDFCRVRNLLIETYPITPVDFNWEIWRWDGWRFHRKSPALNPDWKGLIQLWETENGRLIGAVHPDGRCYAQLEIHPDFRPYIEEDMLTWAENHLATPGRAGGRRQLIISVFEYDSPGRPATARWC